MITILPFSRISRPRIEAGVDIDIRPQAKWLVEVIRPDGSIRRPFGDHWIKNLFLNQWATGFFSASTAVLGCGYNVSGNHGSIDTFSLAGFFFTHAITATIDIGTSATAAVATQTALQGYVKTTTSNATAGNSISMDSSTGNLALVIKKLFAAESGAATYNEAGCRALSSQGVLGSQTAGTLLNRVVFPTGLTVAAGEVISMTCAITIPTLSANPQTVTVTAQNGMNISGQLKSVGTLAKLAGGTVTVGGTLTRDASHGLLPNSQSTMKFGLSTSAAFPAYLVAPSALDTNSVTAAWNTYAGGRYRDIIGTWPVGNPAADTAFRSITFCKDASNNTSGYQLLLDSGMTKAAAATLTVGLRFTI